MYDIWRMQVVNALESFNASKVSLITIPERIAELEAQYTKIRSATADGSPVKGGGSGREDILLNNICERDLLKEELVKTKKHVDKINRALGALSEIERKILQIRFIDGVPSAVTKLSRELNLDERTIRNKQSDALVKFAKAFCGIVYS